MSSMYPPAGGQIIYSCVRCRLPLLPDVPVCRNCGWYNSLPPQSLANDIFAMTGQNQPTVANNGFGMPVQSQQLHYNAFASTYQPAQTAINGFAPGGYYQPQPQKSGPNVILILLIVIGLLLVIGAGSMAGYFFLTQKQNPSSTTATPAVVTPSIKPLFRDSFQNNATGWYLTSSPGSYAESIAGGQMLLEDDNNQLLWEILPGRNFGDFRLDVDAKLTKGNPGNGYGVYIRGTAGQNIDIALYYRFELYGDGSYGLFKGSLDANSNPQSSQISTFMTNATTQKEGNVNHITIIAKGSNMKFMINGVLVFNLNDSSYKGGEVALFVSNVKGLPRDAQAAFSNLAIFPVS
jgi:Domain of Unknown Function (DUF1080)